VTDIRTKKSNLVKIARTKKGYLGPCFDVRTNSPFVEYKAIGKLAYYYNFRLDNGEISTSCEVCELGET